MNDESRRQRENAKDFDTDGSSVDDSQFAAQRSTVIDTNTVDDALTPDRHSGDTTVELPAGWLRGKTKGGNLPDQQRVGNYRILRELGRGGMGVVYLAQSEDLDRTVALKMILAGANASTEELQRFQKEARAVAQLQHPGVVQIFEFGEFRQQPYFTMEYVDGQNLQTAFERQPQNPRHAARLVEQLSRTLQHAHENGILHRDIKPSNILLTNQGTPKITDFGLARRIRPDDLNDSTMSGLVIGSPAYMPPEQAQGKSALVTAQSDIYSLGALLYEALTGRPPYLGKQPIQTLLQVIHGDPLPVEQLQPDIPKDLATICTKAMQKEKSLRYSTCADLADDLQRFLSGKPIEARPIGRITRLVKWCHRNPLIAFPSLFATVTLITTAIIAVWAWSTTSAQAIALTKERDNVRAERDTAQQQRKVSLQQKAEAERNAKLARDQAGVALESIQFVVTEVDGLLRDQPQLTKSRISILKGLSERWDDINIELVGGVQGESIATHMAVRHRIAIGLADLNQVEEADEEFRKLFEQSQQRIALMSGTDASRSNLVKIATAWAPVRKRATNDPNTEIELLQQAMEVANDILDEPNPRDGNPTRLELRGLKAAVAQNLGVAYLRIGDLKRSVILFSESLAEQEAALLEIRNTPGFAARSQDEQDTATATRQLEYDRASVALAYVQLRLGKTEEAVALYERAIAGRREILERRPNVGALQEPLAGFLSNFGNSMIWLEQTQKARSLLEDAITIGRQLFERDRTITRNIRQLALSCYRLAVLCDLENQPDMAKTLLKECHGLRMMLFEAAPGRKNRISLMLVDARLGNTESATQLLEEPGDAGVPDAEANFDRARAFAQLSRSSGNQARQNAMISNAISALERAVQDGYADPFRIRAEPDLIPLRGKPGFRKIVDKLSGNHAAQPPANSP